MSSEQTAYGLVLGWADLSPREPALMAPGRAALDYAGLVTQIERTAGSLRGHGIGPGDRVAIVMENGPESAAAFLGVSAVATACPLSTAYRASEYAGYLDDLQPCAVLLESGSSCEIVPVARELGIRILQAKTDTAMPAGYFDLFTPADPVDTLEYAGPEDIALLLHTSGTTARPKLVPLAHHNLVACVQAIIKTLELHPSDRCLNIMPLFHVHGLVGAMLCTLGSGGSIICTGGLDTSRFFDWLEELGPTWYTSAPSMHQSVCQRARAENRAIRHTLRFVRSAAAALPPTVADALEELFDVPAIEAYGMSEASQQICSNPLTPQNQKRGSVGLPAGPEVAVLDTDGRFHEHDASGEVVIRGASVFSGYLDNPEANAESFIDGWLRTGDLGRLDADGYLYLEGRCKEMINRGGENISPREIDEALLQHESIAEAIAFAMPDEHLGEEVAAAVVLREGYAASASDIRDFAARSLADFKVPRRIFLTDTIPKGSTGKPQRHLLAAIFCTDEVTGDPELPSPSMGNPAEAIIQQLCQELLSLEEIPIYQSFLDFGGDSIFAMRLISRVNDQFGTNLTILDVFDHPTVARLAGRVMS